MSPGDLQRLFASQERIEQRVDRIDVAIRGSFDGQMPGLNGRVADVEQYISTVKRRRRMARRTVWGFMTAAGAFLLGR